MSEEVIRLENVVKDFTIRTGTFGKGKKNRALMETSSMDTGSSATMNEGLLIRALAIPTLCLLTSEGIDGKKSQ